MRRHHAPQRRGAGFVVAALVATTIATAAPASATPAQEPATSYVALGDSGAAGPLIPNPTGIVGCFRSDHNYPHLVAPLGQQEFRDVSCSGATTEHMYQPQLVAGGPNPPQLDAVDANTKLVTLSIGANDINFTEIFIACGSLLPVGTPCQNRFNPGGNDEISRRISATATKVGNLLRAIEDRAPDASILIVGAPHLLPDTGPGCWPVLPYTPEDVAYLRAKIAELNAMYAAQANAHGDIYVDVYTPSAGHDACQPPAVRWLEPLIPANVAAPYHFNARGMQGVAEAVLATLPTI